MALVLLGGGIWYAYHRGWFGSAYHWLHQRAMKGGSGQSDQGGMDMNMPGMEMDSMQMGEPGKPSEDEWEELKRHPADGARITRSLRGWLGEWAPAIEQHHERWDGSGYPAGLAGELYLATAAAAGDCPAARPGLYETGSVCLAARLRRRDRTHAVRPQHLPY